jgi:hypothetical protein
MKKLKDNVTDKVTENTVETVGENSDLQITESAKKSLLGMRQWTKCISVLYYAGMGIMGIRALVALFEGNSIGFIIGCIYLVIATLLFMLGTDLHFFAKSVKSALADNDVEEMEKAFINLKSYWRLFGISTIILLFLPIALFIFGNVLQNG